MGRFLRSKKLRAALWLAADGRCQRCGIELPDNWHADHIEPWSRTGRTNVHEMQALCPACNSTKGTAMMRKHQEELSRWMKQRDAAELMRKGQVVAFVWPGGGKSSLPIIAGEHLRRAKLIDKIVVVVPRKTLRTQGAGACSEQWLKAAIDHNIELRETDGNQSSPCRGMTGYVTTYQSITEDPRLHADYAKAHRILLCLDEVHHVGERSKTQKQMQEVYDGAAFRLLMTGTLDRNEGDRIAFLNYNASQLGGKETPDVDISYGLQDALRDQAVIPIEFQHIDGKVEYVDRFGERINVGTLTEERPESRDSIYAAVNTEYATQLLTACVESWQRWQKAHPNSLMLAVCASIHQAKRIRDQLASMGVNTDIATSEDGESAVKAIKSFRLYGVPKCLVTVAMAYEGLDVKPITHIACLTHIRSRPWLMQMFGRASRFDPMAGKWEHQRAFVFCPDDPLMQEAIDYVRQEQIIGVPPAFDDHGGEDDEGSEQSETSTDLREFAGIVPLGGAATKERVSGLVGDLNYTETARVAMLMERHNVHGSIMDVAALLRAAGADLSTGEATRFTGEVSATPGEREDKLKQWIDLQIKKLDRETNSKPGTFNKRCFSDAQNNKPRGDLTERELEEVWAWVCRESRRLGIEVAER